MTKGHGNNYLEISPDVSQKFSRSFLEANLRNVAMGPLQELDLPQRQQVASETSSKISSNISNTRKIKNDLFGDVRFPAPPRSFWKYTGSFWEVRVSNQKMIKSLPRTF